MDDTSAENLQLSLEEERLRLEKGLDVRLLMQS